MLLAVYPCLQSLLITFRKHYHRIRAIIPSLRDAHHHWLWLLIRPCHPHQFVVAEGRVHCVTGNILKVLLAHADGAAIVILVIVLLFVAYVIVTILPLLHAERLGQFT